MNDAGFDPALECRHCEGSGEAAGRETIPASHFSPAEYAPGGRCATCHGSGVARCLICSLEGRNVQATEVDDDRNPLCSLCAIKCAEADAEDFHTRPTIPCDPPEDAVIEAATRDLAVLRKVGHMRGLSNLVAS